MQAAREGPISTLPATFVKEPVADFLAEIVARVVVAKHCVQPLGNENGIDERVNVTGGAATRAARSSGERQPVLGTEVPEESLYSCDLLGHEAEASQAGFSEG